MKAYLPGVFANTYETKLGRRLWAFVNEPENFIRMETATKLGRPAVEALEEGLLEEFGDAVLEDRIKQMIGHMVRQVMEGRGLIIAVQNTKVTNGAPFSRATKYKRPSDVTYHAFRSSSDPRTFALTLDKSMTALPTGHGRWSYYKSVTSGLRVQIAFNVADEITARANIANEGYHLTHVPRMLRAGNN